MSTKTLSDADVRRAVNHSDIINVLNRFVLSVDMRDWAKMRACLTDRVAFDYAALDSQMPTDADDLVARVKSDQEPFHAVQHLLSTHDITVEGDTACCVVNFRARHLYKHTKDGIFWTLAGRYVYTLARETNDWKVRGCVIRPSWSETDGKLDARHETSSDAPR